MAKTSTNSVTVLEQYRVSPPPGSVPQRSLPLTFFDVPWLNFAIRRLLFYHFPYSTAYFIQTTVPHLKTSLSLVLRHYFPFAGTLVTPSSSGTKPEICYVDGDYVSLTFAESTKDFNHLTGNHPREVEDFFPLLPLLPPVHSNDSKISSLLAVQVTLFPNHGISIGIINDHTVADGRTMFNFIQAWAAIAKLNGDAPPLEGLLLPFFDRSVIEDQKGLYNIFLSQIEKYKQETSQPQKPDIKKVQVTFVMHRADIQDFKYLVSTKRPTLKHVSSFTAVCAYIWTCLAKTRLAIGVDVHEDESEHFAFVFDCRGRSDPPIPENYFGNCLGFCLATAKSTQILGDDGFLIAAELIAEAIQRNLHNKEEVLKRADKWLALLNGERWIGVAGSPKFNYYNCIDFGWGKPKKFEIVGEPFSLSSCKESEGHMEIGLSMSKVEMDAFTPIFAKGIRRPM